MSTITEVLRALLDKATSLRSEVDITIDNAEAGYGEALRNLTSPTAEHEAAIDVLSTLSEALEAAVDKFAVAVKDMEDDCADHVEREYEDEKRFQRGSVL